jgi:hypothetical protein
MHPTTEEVHNTQRYYEIYSVILQMRTAAAAVKKLATYFGTGVGSHLNPHSPSSFLITQVNFNIFI